MRDEEGQRVEQTVFVVDDDDALRLALTRLLVSYGYAVRDFARATELLAIATPDLCGCVIVDVRMPEEDGLSFHAKLREAGVELPVIFLSGYADISATVRAMQQGALTFLLKPCSDRTLIDAVKAALAQERETREERREQQRLKAAMATLDARERSIMADLADGHLNKTIAGRLGLSEITIKVIRARIMRKMGAPSSAHLARFFERLKP